MKKQVKSYLISNELVSEIINGTVIDIDKAKMYLNNIEKHILQLSETKNIRKKLELSFYIGILYFALQKYSIAKPYLLRAIPLEPRLVYYILGLTFYNMAQQNRVTDHYLAMQKDYNAAIKNYEKALNIESTTISDFQIYYDISVIYYELQDSYKVSLAMEKMLDFTPDSLFDESIQKIA